MTREIGLMLRRVARRFQNWWHPTDPVEAARDDGVAPAVVRLIEAIANALPKNYYADYELLSPGQQALADALVYLHYQRLPQARTICAEAMGDPCCPGDSWVKELLEAIDIASRMPGTDPDAADTQRQARLAAKY